MPNCFFGRGSASDPAGGAYSAPQTPSWFKGAGGLLLKGGGREGRGGEGREGKRREGEGKGEGRESCAPFLKFLDPPLLYSHFWETCPPGSTPLVNGLMSRVNVTFVFINNLQDFSDHFVVILYYNFKSCSQIKNYPSLCLSGVCIRAHYLVVEFGTNFAFYLL